MKKLMNFLLIIIILTTPIIISCQRIDNDKIKGELTTIKLTDLKAIPLDYGKLIAVTSPSNYPDWVHLWFEDENRTIRMIRVGFADDRLHEKVTVIPRN